MFNDTLLLENFAIHETIFVMPAYRLGIFGFLDMGPDDLDAPQNAGLLGKSLLLDYMNYCFSLRPCSCSSMDPT